jgi:hypothetical protein
MVRKCAICGTEISDKAKSGLCKEHLKVYHAAKKKADREKLLAIGLCPICKSGATLPGLAVCVDCRTKEQQRGRGHYRKTKGGEVWKDPQKTSRFVGVSWRKEEKIWDAIINKNKKTYRLGLFKNEIEAARAYNIKAAELYGDKAKLNKFTEAETEELNTIPIVTKSNISIVKNRKLRPQIRAYDDEWELINRFTNLVKSDKKEECEAFIQRLESENKSDK